MKKNSHPEKNVSPRNSRLREYSTKPAEKIAQLLHTAFPWLTPNEITALGTAGVGVLVLYVLKLEKEGKIDRKTGIQLVLTYGTLSATDLFDGSLARYLKKIGAGTHDSSIGQLVDSLSDRVQEAFTAWLAMYLAASRNDRYWFLIATLSAFSNPLTSIVRAYAEMQGIVVPESGEGLGIFGTRVVRAGAASSRFLPEKNLGPTSAQALIDSVTLTSTLKTTSDRFKAVRKKEHVKVLDTKSQDEAKRRFRLLTGLALITGTTTAVLFAKLRKKMK